MDDHRTTVQAAGLGLNGGIMPAAALADPTTTRDAIIKDGEDLRQRCALAIVAVGRVVDEVGSLKVNAPGGKVDLHLGKDGALVGVRAGRPLEEWELFQLIDTRVFARSLIATVQKRMLDSVVSDIQAVEACRAGLQAYGMAAPDDTGYQTETQRLKQPMSAADFARWDLEDWWPWFERLQTATKVIGATRIEFETGAIETADSAIETYLPFIPALDDKGRALPAFSVVDPVAALPAPAERKQQAALTWVRSLLPTRAAEHEMEKPSERDYLTRAVTDKYRIKGSLRFRGEIIEVRRETVMGPDGRALSRAPKKLSGPGLVRAVLVDEAAPSASACAQFLVDLGQPEVPERRGQLMNTWRAFIDSQSMPYREEIPRLEIAPVAEQIARQLRLIAARRRGVMLRRGKLVAKLLPIAAAASGASYVGINALSSAGTAESGTHMQQLETQWQAQRLMVRNMELQFSHRPSWIVLLSESGQPLEQFKIKGRVFDPNAQVTGPQSVPDPNGGGVIAFFTAKGVEVTWEGPYIQSDKPISLKKGKPVISGGSPQSSQQPTKSKHRSHRGVS